ncbi:MAG TPA: hypothetical protein VD837_07955 [Terriglobales bacterium]|nr:hypothetical protein [Terriglobales bacterium]
MHDLKHFREYGLDNTLADTFPCSDALSSIPNPNNPHHQDLGGNMAVQQNTSERRYLQRECPICGYTHLVAVSEFHDSLICEKCGYVIPAKKKAA